MKDKEKQINEMAKDLNEVETDVGHILVNETFYYVKEHKKYNPKKDFSKAHTKTFEELTAEEMFKKGYRKLPEDSVVLSRAEYESDLTAQYDVAYEKASKETAEKILFKFESAFAYYDNEDMFSKKAIFECLEEIIKNCC